MASFVHTLLQGMRPVFVGADLGRTPLSAALAQAGHFASEPTLFVAGDASCARRHMLDTISICYHWLHRHEH